MSKNKITYNQYYRLFYMRVYMKPRNIVSGLILFSIIIIAAMYSLDKMSAFHAKDNITPLGFPIKIFREEYTCYGSNCHQIVTILLQREDYSYVNIVKLSNWYKHRGK